MTPLQAYSDMESRCQHVTVLGGDRITHELGTEAMGVIIRVADGGFLAVEVGQNEAGEAYVAARAYTENGSKRRPAYAELDDEIMVTL